MWQLSLSDAAVYDWDNYWSKKIKSRFLVSPKRRCPEIGRKRFCLFHMYANQENIFYTFSHRCNSAAGTVLVIHSSYEHVLMFSWTYSHLIQFQRGRFILTLHPNISKFLLYVNAGIENMLVQELNILHEWLKVQTTKRKVPYAS